MEIVELERLELQKEYNVTAFFKQWGDIMILFFIMACFVAYGYQSLLPLIPFVILLMVFVIGTDIEDEAKENNDVKLDHVLKQSEWFEIVRHNASKYVDGEK